MAAALAGVLLTAPGAPAASQKERGRFSAVASPVRLVPAGPGILRVLGLHGYFGSIELKSAGDGITIVNRLPLEQYLLGLQEVPTEWPPEALRAQAVAARTYALWTLSQPPAGAAATYGFQICASIECQVFSGADVVTAAGGERWAGAVKATARRVVLYEEEPILARYHSTSGGETLENSQAFPDEGSYPYLQPVGSPWEEESPLYRWRVRFELADLDTMLSQAGLWDARRGRLVELRTRPSDEGLHYPDVVLEGTRRRVVVTAEELREIVRAAAPALRPGRYPSPWPTSSGFLPETLPSNRYEIDTRDGTAVVRGRGWGHGVGMSQWGAHGLARRGSDHEDILTHYYTGTEVGVVEGAEMIAVGVDWAQSHVSVLGDFRIVDGTGRTLMPRALGTWGFRWAGPGVIALEPPDGYRLPLRVGLVAAPSRVDAGETVRFTVALSRPARIKTSTVPPPSRLREPEARVADAGRRTVAWTAPESPGEYEVRVEASTGDERRRTRPVQVRVAGSGGGGEAAPPEPPGDGDRDLLLPVVIVVLGVIVVAGMALRRRMTSNEADDG